MPYRQTRGSTCGRRFPQCLLKHVHLCSSRGGWVENVTWSSIVWVRHVSVIYRRVTSTEAFCQSACRFEVCFLMACILRSLGFWFLINRGRQTFWNSFGNFLLLKFSFLLPLSSLHSAPYNSSHHPPVAPPFTFSDSTCILHQCYSGGRPYSRWSRCLFQFYFGVNLHF